MNLLHYLVSKRLQLVPMTSKITLKPVKKKKYHKYLNWQKFYLFG